MFESLLQVLRTGIERLTRKAAAPPPPRVRATTHEPLCTGCANPIPLRLPFPDETGSHWQCVRCGYRFFAVLDENRDPSLLDRVRLTGVSIRGEALRRGPGQTAEFVDAVAGEIERRQASRSPLKNVLLVQPVSTALEPQGEPTLVRTQDFSERGICFLSSRAIPGNLLVASHITSTGQTLQVVLQVARRAVTSDGWEIAAEFVPAEQVGGGAEPPKGLPVAPFPATDPWS